MKLQDAVKPFIQSIVAPKLLVNQAEALGIFVSAALTLSRAILTDLAAEMHRHGFTATVKHGLKRLDRWINNPGIKVSAAMAGIVGKLASRRKKKLIISVDWVDIREFKVLVAAANIKGRAVWLMWKSVPECGLNLHMNRIEQEVLFDLRQMIPQKLRVVILADRGFHKSILFTFCRTMHFDYVVRIKADYHVEGKAFRGLLSTLPTKPGTQRFWKNVACGRKPVIRQNIVVWHQRNLPERRDEPWFLATSLQGSASQVVRLYARRMGIEECFRDAKNVNNGWHLRKIRVKTALALDHLLLILALAYLLLCGIGLWCLKHLPPRTWSANNRPCECAVFTIARRMLGLVQLSLDQILAEICIATKMLAPRWG